LSTSTLGELRFLNEFTSLPAPSLAEARRFGACCNLMNKLEYLDMQYVGLGGEALAGVCARLRPAALPKLKALLLRGNPVGDQGVLGLCVALAKPIRAMPGLETLDLSGAESDEDDDLASSVSFSMRTSTGSGGRNLAPLSGATSPEASSDSALSCASTFAGPAVAHAPSGGTFTPRQPMIDEKRRKGRDREPSSTVRISSSRLTDAGVAALAAAMESGGLQSCKRLYLHRNPRLGSVGIESLSNALLCGSCGSMTTIYLEGHCASAEAEKALARVMYARNIASDLSIVKQTHGEVKHNSQGVLEKVVVDEDDEKSR